MKTRITLAGIALLALSATAFSQPASTGRAGLMTAVPNDSKTVTNWYKQDVYDPGNNKIGEIMDVLVSADGKVNTLIVGVGGFLGAGEKDVAVGFDAVKQTSKNDKMYLKMDTTKDALKTAPGFRYDRDKTTWVPDDSSRKNTQ